MSGLRPFVFLDLPLEIRDMIYGYLLIHESSTKVFKREDLSYACCLHSRVNEELLSTLNNKANPRQNYDLHPTILRTNRQVHEEALRALYGENYFTLTTDQLDVLRYWNEMRNRWNDTDMHRFDRLLEPIKNPAILSDIQIAWIRTYLHITCA